MNKEKDFFKTCFDTMAGLEVKNESQAIAKEVVLNEVENLEQENKKLKEIIKENTILVKDEYGDYQECNINPLEMKQKYEKQVNNWNKLKEDLWKIRQLTFTKYNKNEWENCLSFNDDILPLIKEMQTLEQGSDSDVEN